MPGGAPESSELCHCLLSGLFDLPKVLEHSENSQSQNWSARTGMLGQDHIVNSHVFAAAGTRWSLCCGSRTVEVMDVSPVCVTRTVAL